MENNLVLEPRNSYDYTPDSNTVYDLIIVGGGVTGFSCAMYAKRLGMKVLIIGSAFGGTIMFTNHVENWPGLISVTGQQLAKLVENHAKDYDVDILNEMVEEISKTDVGFKAKTKSGEFSSKTILFATGTKLRRLGVPGEGTFSGKGVSYCALCDGMFFRDKIVGVVGGSDSAIKEALFLSEHAKKVYVIYRGEQVHPEKIILNRMNKLIEGGKIVVVNNTNVTEIKGDKLMSHVILDREFKGKNELALDGLFIDIGREPLSELTKSLGVELNEKNEIKIDRLSKTNIEGVFAGGDVTDFPMKQAITGSSAGIIGAYSSYEYLQKN
ncbi:MAG: FAD-dependent oxidoreductase [Candidatus Pacearchaeota archaeon]|nr:FAD-dependent oxidoreductase [Candidatus Pacearchaeota archaeon]